MSEVKNEGLEVVATLTVSFDEGDGGSAIEQVETHMLLDEGAHDLCRHSEALAVIAEREARIAELEEEVKTSAECLDMANELYETHKDKNCQLRAELAALNARLDASKFCANVADDLRAELAAAKETIARYETTAENCDLLRSELAAIKGQVPGAIIPRLGKFNTSKGGRGYVADFFKNELQRHDFTTYINERLAADFACALADGLCQLYAAPAPSAVVMPAAPDGYKLVPIEPTAAQCFTAAFNLCNEFGEEFVRDNEQFAMAAYRWLVAASPAAKGAKP